MLNFGSLEWLIWGFLLWRLPLAVLSGLIVTDLVATDPAAAGRLRQRFQAPGSSLKHFVKVKGFAFNSRRLILF